MKKSRILAAAMASIALTGTLSSCRYLPSDNIEPDVYGPPAPYEEPSEEPAEAQSEEPADTTDPAFDPERNIEPGVYGPPSAFDGD